MKEQVIRFFKEEDGDVVQNVIIIAIFAALALLFGNTIKDFVEGLIKSISGTGEKAKQLAEDVAGQVS